MSCLILDGVNADAAAASAVAPPAAAASDTAAADVAAAVHLYFSKYIYLSTLFELMLGRKGVDGDGEGGVCACVFV